MEHGIAAIVIEHRLELLAAVATRVVVLHLGTVIAHATPDEVFDDPAVRAVYFDHVAAEVGVHDS